MNDFNKIKQVKAPGGGRNEIALVMAQLPRTLRAARQAAGLTQEELAAQLGLTYATVSHYETGRREPTLGRIAEILAVCGLVLKVTITAADHNAIT